MRPLPFTFVEYLAYVGTDMFALYDECALARAFLSVAASAQDFRPLITGVTTFGTQRQRDHSYRDSLGNKTDYYGNYLEKAAPLIIGKYRVPDRPKNPPPRVIPSMEYKALQSLAIGIGGIGFGAPYENYMAPVKGRYVLASSEWGEPVEPLEILAKAIADRQRASTVFFNAGLFDDEATNWAPRRIIAREGIPFGAQDPWPRFRFDVWCRELNIIEGEK